MLTLTWLHHQSNPQTKQNNRPAVRKQDLARAAEVAVISIKFLYYKHDSLAAKVRVFPQLINGSW